MPLFSSVQTAILLVVEVHRVWRYPEDDDEDEMAFAAEAGAARVAAGRVGAELSDGRGLRRGLRRALLELNYHRPEPTQPIEALRSSKVLLIFGVPCSNEARTSVAKQPVNEASSSAAVVAPPPPAPLQTLLSDRTATDRQPSTSSSPRLHSSVPA